jgi:signal transduction histidine kinase
MNRFAVIGLREKILLGMIAIVFALVVPTLFVVNYWLSRSVDRKIAQDFARARVTFARLSAINDSLLVREGRLLSESPLLAKALEAKDRARVGEALAAAAPNGPVLDYYEVADPGGVSMARLGVVSSLADQRTANRLEVAALRGSAATGTFVLGDLVYGAVACPIRDSLDVVGTLIVGKCVTQDFVDDLGEMTGNEVALRVGERVTLTTLAGDRRARFEEGLAARAADFRPLAEPERPAESEPPADAEPPAALASPSSDVSPASVLPAGLSVADGAPPPQAPTPRVPGARAVPPQTTTGRILLDGERHLACSIPVTGVGGEVLGEFLLFQSMDEASRFFDDLRRAILGIGAVAGCLALVLALVTSRGVTGNVRHLVRGVREVENGNYDQPIARRSRDEIGYLAGVFDEMRQSLRTRLEEARSLTEDLRGKNETLEETLAKLRRAQEHLVRTERAAVTSRLAAQLSHELNNPIYNAQTCLDVLRRRVPQGDQTRTFIDLVYDEVLHMGRLTKQMMGLAKSGAAAMAPTDVNAVLTALLGISTLWLEEKRIRVETAFAPGLPHVLASSDQLRQVFLNLIVNASDAMPGGGHLTIETEAAGGSVVARVRDTGCGILPENIDKIFDAFFSTKPAVAGVGLGLSISYEIVQRHNGRIDVQSEPGKGACFTVTLPAIDAAAKARG